jgi:Transposase
LDHVRKSEYRRLAGRDLRYIKGQKYTLLSRKENLTVDGKKALKTLLSANRRLNTAYVLKESFGQLWSYEREGWARRFFENWRGSLKWQRLKPYEKFAEMIDRHWDGIAAYCRPENKVSLGFVEGLNNKIWVASATRLSAYPGLVPRAWRAIAKRRTTCARRCSGSSILAPTDRTRRLHRNSEHMGVTAPPSSRTPASSASRASSRSGVIRRMVSWPKNKIRRLCAELTTSSLSLSGTRYRPGADRDLPAAKHQSR